MDESTNSHSSIVAARSTSESLAQYQTEQLKRVKERLPNLRTMLLSAGVLRVEITYDGIGDSGQIESVQYIGRTGAEINPFGPTASLKEEIQDLFYDLLEIRFAGWENNDGAYGDFSWELSEDAMNQTHHERFTDCTTTEVEGL